MSEIANLFQNLTDSFAKMDSNQQKMWTNMFEYILKIEDSEKQKEIIKFVLEFNTRMYELSKMNITAGQKYELLKTILEGLDKLNSNPNENPFTDPDVLNEYSDRIMTASDDKTSEDFNNLADQYTKQFSLEKN